jgi:hypothetical protein
MRTANEVTRPPLQIVPAKRCRLRRSMQHLLAIYLPEFGSPRLFWTSIQGQCDLVELRL